MLQLMLQLIFLLTMLPVNSMTIPFKIDKETYNTKDLSKETNTQLNNTNKKQTNIAGQQTD